MQRDRRWLVASGLFLALAANGAEPSPPAASATRGALIYERCAACHALAFDRTGPRHCGLIGRRAGSLPGFDYSPALRQSKLVWSEATLDQFLKNPLGTIPGTATGYDGVKDDNERRDLIAYLRAAGDGPECRAPPP